MLRSKKLGMYPGARPASARAQFVPIAVKNLPISANAPQKQNPHFRRVVLMANICKPICFRQLSYSPRMTILYTKVRAPGVLALFQRIPEVRLARISHKQRARITNRERGCS